jgi:propanediol utilization protein
VVVGLDLERDGGPVAEIEDSRVLAGPPEHSLAGRGQTLQERGRMLVAAVLGPEEREDRELEVVRVAAEQLPDTVRFPVRQTKGAVEGLMGGQLRQVIQCNPGCGGISREAAALRSSR